MFVKCILLYNKSGVYSGIHIFLIFDPKHRLWVLVRTVSVLHGQVFVMCFIVHYQGLTYLKLTSLRNLAHAIYRKLCSPVKIENFIRNFFFFLIFLLLTLS